MQTAKEIEAKLAEAAQRFREVTAAAKDIAAKATPEPAVLARTPIGNPIAAPAATIAGVEVK